ncbi:MAG: lactate permease LctP family transporter [Thermodesulfovibrionales bacterium]|nr:lactate permease LctP family transporter [Thermodesulfovibrionales bacterium]
MTWSMNIDPFGAIGLSAIVAAIPIFFLFIALAWLKMKGHIAATIATVLAIGVAILVYGMPAQYALLATFQGMLFGLFPVCWIVITALFIYNMSVTTGQFEIIKNSLASISDDRRMQALLIAFSFGAFIEGAAGFGTPVAMTCAMLVGLGFNPLYAAGICLLANTAPVAFGAIGIPIVVGAQVSGVDEMALSKLVGRTLPFLSCLIPLYLVILMAGWKKGLEAWPACFVTGGSFAIAQYLSSNFLGPYLPDIIASLTSIVATVIFLKVWHPKESWRFPNEPKSEGRAQLLYSGGQVFRAWAPFIILSLFVAAWGIKPVKAALDQIFLYKWTNTGLHNMVINYLNKPVAAVYTFNFLSAAGTAILFAWFISIPVMGASIKTALQVAGNTLKQLRWPIYTIATILGFAYIMNYSGAAITLGTAFAASGAVFPFFAAFIGWLGVFMTGSDTSTNALFGKLQAVTAEKIGVDPVVTMSANTSGGVCGKMISPQSISVATAATNLVGHEGDIFRFTVIHSIILTAVIGALHYLWAYVFPGIIPTYEKIVAGAPKPVVDAAAEAAKKAAMINEGYMYLIGAFVIIILVAIIARVVGKGEITLKTQTAKVHMH